jgi:hypothetical protein
MRRIAFLLLLAPLSVAAQPYGPVWLAPANGSGFVSTCLFSDDSDTELCEVAVVVALSGSWAALEGFRVVSGIPWVWVGDLSAHTVLGNSQAGASIAFDPCLGPTTAVMTIRYLCAGTAPCGQLSIATAPWAPSPELVSCDGGTRTPVGGGTLTVNGVFEIPPGGDDPDCFCLTVPVEAQTWGRIKALYE